MNDSHTFDPDDLRLVRALQIDPRVPFAAVATVLGVSEPTVSRRYGRLRRAGVLRVAGIVDPRALGQIEWTVRLRCRPGSGAAIAQAVAHRDDVSWVSLSAAGAEVTFAVRSRSPQDREDLVARRIPRAAAVLDLEVAVVLRQFLGGRGHYWAALTGVLTAEQEADLGASGPPFREPATAADLGPGLDARDEQLLSALAVDGRASLVALGSAAGLSPGQVTRRLGILVSHGVARIDVEIVPQALGFHARANLWLRVHPSRVKAVGSTLARLPEVGFVAAVSGRSNLHAVVHFRDLDELFEFSSDRVGSLPGVEAAEVSVIDRQVKQAGTLVAGDRLEPPAGTR